MVLVKTRFYNCVYWPNPNFQYFHIFTAGMGLNMGLGMGFGMGLGMGLGLGLGLGMGTRIGMGLDRFQKRSNESFSINEGPKSTFE